MRTALQSTDTSETAVKFKIMAGVSCEPGRRQAYSNDLRWRMVWQREVLGYKYDQIAVNLNVHPSTVFRVTKLFSTSGSVDHKPYLRDKLFRSFTPTVELILLHIVLQKPGIYYLPARNSKRACRNSGCRCESISDLHMLEEGWL